MKSPDRPSFQPRNLLTAEKHRREGLLQITLPFVGALILLIGLAFLLGKATAFNHAQGAQIALVGLILPLMLFGLFLFVITIGLIVGVTKLLRILPTYTRSMQDFFTLVAYQTRRVADGSVEPILRLQEWLAIWRYLRRRGLP